jgi:hypothetical protein
MLKSPPIPFFPPTSLLVLTAVLAFATIGLAQHVPTNTPQGPPADTPPQSQSNGIPAGMETSEAAKGNPSEVPYITTARFRRERFIREYFQNLNRDVDRILDLASEFNQYAGKNPGPDLSPEMIKKIRKMGDLSHDLRKLMYNRNLPHLKNSGITFLPPRQDPNSRAQDPPPHFQPMADACFEFATHLRADMDKHLASSNLNTVTVSQAQLDLARDIVKTARLIEGLAYELEHKQL